MKNTKDRTPTIDEIVAKMRELVQSNGRKPRVYVPTISVRAWLGLAREIEIAGAVLKANAQNAYNGCLKCDEHKKQSVIEKSISDCLEIADEMERDFKYKLQTIRDILQESKHKCEEI